MIKHTTYSVAFPTSGVSLKGQFSPQPGLTAVIGPNGVGKTFGSIELTRYLLYGKKALRGAAADYKSLDAQGTYTIRGVDYTIKRSAKHESITDSTGHVLATGAEAVTLKVEELMGYGLAVFDITNASVQKQADLIGRLLPSKRKQLIDEVVGITSVKDVEKALRDEASVLKREAEALSRQLREPEKPDEAEHRPVVTIEHHLTTSRALRREYDDLVGQIKSLPDVPQKPARPRPTMEMIREVEVHERERAANRKEFLRLDRIMQRAMLYTTYTREDLQAARDRNSLRELLANQIECPKCAHEFVPGHGHVELPEGPDLTSDEILSHERGIKMREEHDEAYKTQQAIPSLEDRSQELKQLEQDDRDWEQYEYNLAQFDKIESQNERVQAELSELDQPLSHDELDELANELMEARLYEAAVARYEEDVRRFEELSTQIKEKLRLADEFKKGSESLSDARAVLKANLAPIMSRIASELITDMTHGKLSSVVIDEDMEITVNGQGIETLSGGGETVANLAIRLAIGQALVSRTFPVFLGDEMDADADDSRREAVVEALRSLLAGDRLTQVVLVTHRGVEDADHILDLGST